MWGHGRLVDGHGVRTADCLDHIRVFPCEDELSGAYYQQTPLRQQSSKKHPAHQIRIRRAPRRIRKHLFLAHKRHLRVIILEPLIGPIRQPPLVDEVVPEARRRPAVDEHARELVLRPLRVPPDVLQLVLQRDDLRALRLELAGYVGRFVLE